jgi:hypothetical protein
LKRAFPWLGTDQEVSPVEVVEQLRSLYASLPGGKASSEWARKLSARRKTFTGGTHGGRPPTYVTCPKCGAQSTKSTFRRHRCP